jgi:hypothetical protein
LIDIGRELREQPLDNGDSLTLAFHASAVADAISGAIRCEKERLAKVQWQVMGNPESWPAARS